MHTNTTNSSKIIYLEGEFRNDNIIYVRERALIASFKGEKNRRNIPDFLVEGKITLDLKAKQFITKEDYFQMRRYSSASNIKLGLIINFRQMRIYPKRIAN